MKKENLNNIMIDLAIENYNMLLQTNTSKLLQNINSNKEDYFRYIPSYNINTLLKEIIEIQNISSKKFIDIGCGYPAISSTISHFVKESYGLEYNPLIVQYLKKCNEYHIKKINLIEGDLIEYNFKDFDILYAYNPIINYNLMKKGLSNILSTMKKNAILYFYPAADFNYEIICQKIENKKFTISKLPGLFKIQRIK